MKIRGKKSGFTLLEATFAMVLLAIAAAGILLPFANAAAVNAEGSRQTIAANLAAEMMERIAATSYEQILTNYGSYPSESVSGTHTSSAYTGFSWEANCSEEPLFINGKQIATLIKATVIVCYNNRQMTKVTTLVGNHE